MRRLTAAALAAFPAAALAHGGNAHGWWSFDPWVWMPLLLCAVLYLRGLRRLRAGAPDRAATRPAAVLCFCGGMAAAFLALIWPLDALGERSFAAHMAQHMMLIAVAAPLLALARPGVVLAGGLPSSWRRLNRRLALLHAAAPVLARPGAAFALHGVLVWIWHAPLLFELALRLRWVHVLEHACFLGSALLFWHALQRCGRRGGEGYGAAALWTLGTLMHTGLLGALLTFAPRALYGYYGGIHEPLLPPLEDQQLAGLLMWVPGGICYLIAGLGYAAAWLRAAGMPSAAAGKPGTRARTE